MTLFVVTEDQLSETVALKLVRESHPAPLEILRMRKNGFGYLRSNLRKFCRIAERDHVLMLTDLDRAACPSKLISDWFGGDVRPQRLAFRVAVPQVESWLLADRIGLASFFGISAAKINPSPDSIGDSKEHLLRLARVARREIRYDLLPLRGVRASQGFGYNQRLCEFVENGWSSVRGAAASKSLTRAKNKIGELLNSYA